MYITPTKTTIDPVSFYPKADDNFNAWRVKFILEYDTRALQCKVTFKLPPCSLDSVKQWVDRVLSAKAFWKDQGQGPTLYFVNRVVEVEVIVS